MEEKLEKLEETIRESYVRRRDPHPSVAAKFQLKLFVDTVLRGQEKHADLLINDEINAWEKVK